MREIKLSKVSEAREWPLNKVMRIRVKWGFFGVPQACVCVCTYTQERLCAPWKQKWCGPSNPARVLCLNRLYR